MNTMNKYIVSCFLIGKCLVEERSGRVVEFNHGLSRNFIGHWEVGTHCLVANK